MIPFILDLVVCIYSVYFSSSELVVKYTPDQIRKMEEFVRVRRASEPVELIKLVRPRLAFRDLFVQCAVRQICLRRKISGLITDSRHFVFKFVY